MGGNDTLGLRPIDQMHSIRAILPAAVAEIVRRAPMSPEKLSFAWKATVGAAIDRATIVRLGEDGKLEVRVESEPWRKELNRSAKLVLDRLGDWLGEGVVSKVTVIGPPVERPRRRTGRPARRREIEAAAKRTTPRAPQRSVESRRRRSSEENRRRTGATRKKGR